jgi:hypothetical protein
MSILVGHAADMGETKNTYNILAGKAWTETKICRWENNIIIEFRETG